MEVKKADHLKKIKRRRRRNSLSRFDTKSEVTHTELQQLMLKYRLSINELHLKTSISKNDIHGYLAGRKTITTDFVDRINQIGEDNGR
tara:strand:+ start:231 stop:494 length:264 start_codon:yes stop_codon:yes gene_type:complete